MVVHYSHSYGAACDRKPRSMKWQRAGNPALVTCRRCANKAISKNSQWNARDKSETVVVKRVWGVRKRKGMLNFATPVIELTDRRKFFWDDFNKIYEWRL